MAFLFADESGDIVFRKGKRYFVYVGVLTKGQRECERLLNELKEQYPKTFSRKFCKPEIKAAKLEESEIIYFLQGLKKLDYEVFYTFIDTHDPKKEFNRGTDENLKKALVLETIISNIYSVNSGVGKIIIDKGLPQDVRDHLRERLVARFKEVPRIEAKVSHKVAGIQIADLIAWVVANYLKGNALFYPYISDRVRAKTEL